MVPTATADPSAYTYSEKQRLGKRQSTRPGNMKQKSYYTVRPGDSFWQISKKHNVSVGALCKWNNKSPKDSLQVGEQLVIWSKHKSANRGGVVKKVNYKVRSGDSLARISSKFNVRINEIVKWNGINPNRYLQPGQSLKLYVNVMETY